MRELTKRQPGAEMPPWVGGLGLREMAMALNGVALPPSLRRVAKDRLSTLRLSLSYRDPNEVAGIVLRMLTGFPSIRQSGDDARSMVAAYVDLLGGYPPWTVDEARKQWIANARKEGQSLAFPPSAVEWADRCERLANKFHSEATELVNALAAKGLPLPKKDKPGPCHYDPSIGPGVGFFDKSSGTNTARNLQTEGEARTALVARCAELGIDPKAIDAVPNQPPDFGRGRI